MTTVTGSAWTYDEDKARWIADFDPDSVRDIPVAWDEFFADLGSPYGSHSVIAAAPLVSSGSSVADEVIKVRMTTDGTGTLKRVYPFTVRAVAADGQRDDQTLWLRLVQR